MDETQFTEFDFFSFHNSEDAKEDIFYNPEWFKQDSILDCFKEVAVEAEEDKLLLPETFHPQVS
jgi:hypothetical protein